MNEMMDERMREIAPTSTSFYSGNQPLLVAMN